MNMKFPPSRAVCLSALAAAVLVPLCAVLVVAQGQRRAAAPAASPPPKTPLEAATRLLLEGKFDDLESALEKNDKLDARDPNVVALKARALIVRGKYAEAEAALQPAAQRAPASAAALELGLLYQELGRAEADSVLRRVADAQDLLLAGRALHALRRFDEANEVLRSAVARAPGDPAANTAWGDLYL